MQNKKEIKIFYTKDFNEYELLDTGEGEKLERFGPYTFVRPYEDAVWSKTLNKKDWEKSDGKFWSSKNGGKGGLTTLKQRKSGWKFNNKIPKKWEMEYKGIKFSAAPTPFRHLSFFPEQASHWDFIEEKISGSQKNFSGPRFSGAPNPGQTIQNSSGPLSLPEQKYQAKSQNFSPVKFLNLFGYTGVASLFALRAGAEVTHLDASKQSLQLAKENQKLNADLSEAPMRIIEDDVIKFLEREIKRGNKYDAVIMDPPKFGRGSKGEIWNIEKDLPKLLENVKKVLSDEPLFVILTSYATDSSSLSLCYALEEIMKDFKGKVENGELCVKEKSNGRFISLANTAVWSAL